MVLLLPLFLSILFCWYDSSGGTGLFYCCMAYSNNYFAIGSNMIPSTMTSLRNLRIETESTTAAILPHYELAFNIPGSRWIEPSAASVVRDSQRCVHGVLYRNLTDAQLLALGQSEGVPWAYRWERCRVLPYEGDSESAGKNRLLSLETSPWDTSDDSVEALVLTKSELLSFVPTFQQRRPFIPPTRSYLALLQRGAKEWKMDKEYQRELANIATDPFVPGVSSEMLRLAELLNPPSP